MFSVCLRKLSGVEDGKAGGREHPEAVALSLGRGVGALD